MAEEEKTCGDCGLATCFQCSQSESFYTGIKKKTLLDTKLPSLSSRSKILHTSHPPLPGCPGCEGCVSCNGDSGYALRGEKTPTLEKRTFESSNAIAAPASSNPDACNCGCDDCHDCMNKFMPPDNIYR